MRRAPCATWHVVWTTFVHALMQGGKSREELAEITGVYAHTAGQMLKAFRREEMRTVRISGWRKDKSNKWTVALYSLGVEPDAPKPPPESRSSEAYLARRRVYRAKKKAEAAALAAEVAARAAKVEDPNYIRSVQRARSKIRQHAEEV